MSGPLNLRGDVRKSELPYINLQTLGFSPSRTASYNLGAFQDAINSLPLNTGNAFLSPLGFANGGVIVIPRGVPLIGGGRLVLRRGIRIVGQSRESSQLVCTNADGLFLYEDDGGYLPDEIVMENFSIWQKDDVTATSGAAIEIVDGTAGAVYFSGRNLVLHGTYKGLQLSAGIASSLSDSLIEKTVSHGVELPSGGGETLTTSFSFKNVYSHQSVGGSGFKLYGSSYIDLTACASDSNARYGYEGTNLVNARIHGGAEANTLGGALFTNCSATESRIMVVDNAAKNGDGITLDASPGTKIGGSLHADALATGWAIKILGASTGVFLDGIVAQSGSWATTQFCNNPANILGFRANAAGFIGGVDRRWSFGVPSLPPTANQLTVGGTSDANVINGLVVENEFITAGAGNFVAKFAPKTANTAVTYPVIGGFYVPNTVKGAASTINRGYGGWLEDQTGGGTANANLIIGNSAASAGSWGVFSGTTRDSVWLGKHRFVSSTGPTISFGTGTPEAVVTAPVGSMYGRTDGGALTSFYVKESGTGNTGWVPK